MAQRETVGARRDTIGARTKITPRQHQILEMVAAGLSNKQIAEKLRLSPRTVQWHLDRFFAVHGVHKRAAAVAHLLGHQLTPRSWVRKKAREGAGHHL